MFGILRKAVKNEGSRSNFLDLVFLGGMLLSTIKE